MATETHGRPVVLWIMVAGVALIALAGAFTLKWNRSTPEPGPGGTNAAPIQLECHVGGTMQPVITKLAEIYEAKTGLKMEINSAGSGELLAHIEGHKEGDVYVCHDPFMDILMSEKYRLGVDAWTVAELTPVIAVYKGNPKGVTDLADLKREDVELILTDYEKSSLGRMLPMIFNKAGIDFEQFNKDKKIETHRSGGFAANKVKMKNADATIVWKAVAALRPELDTVPITKYLPVPWVDTVTSATGKAYKLTPLRVTICTLTCSEHPGEARKFAEFLASEEAGKVFTEYGFTMAPETIRKEYEGGKKIPR